MKRKLLSSVLALGMIASAAVPALADAENTNQSGFPIVNEPITLTAWIEGGADVDWENHSFIQKIEEESNIKLEIISTPSADALQKRNLLLAGDELPDIMLFDWPTIASKPDIMLYGAKEGIFIPINDLIEEYGNNMKRILEENPHLRESSTAPDGNIYGFPRFSECYHCSAYPKIYFRQDWMDKLGLEMPTTTDELTEVLRAFVTQDPNGNGEADEIGLIGATTWNTPLEYAIMGMAFQTVKPDFWLSLGADGESVEFSVTTDAYREGLRYMHSLYEEGLIDPTSFTQTDEIMAQTIRTEPHVVGMYTCDHAGMGYDTADVAEAENYQILLPVAGPTGFRRQGQNSGEGEIGGYHAIITDACENPEAAFRLIDEYFYDDDNNMYRNYGPQGWGWDYAPEGLNDVFGNPAKYIILPLTEEQNEEKSQHIMYVGPQADLAEFRLSMLPEVENVYEPQNYEQRITMDTLKLQEFIPEKKLMSQVFIPADMSDEYAEISANLNSYIRTATVEFIIGSRDIESDWDSYLNDLEGYRASRYIEIYKAATGLE